MDSEVLYPPFILGRSRFDQATFSGRLRHFFDVIDPRTLFTSKKCLHESVKLLDDFDKGLVSPDVTNEQLWKAQKIKQAIIHPDTGEKIFMPFRMSGFVPFGSPIVVGLLVPHPNLYHTVFWQALNQSHNAAVNYSNRNATKETPLPRFLAGYLGAVSSACAIAVGLSLLIRRANKLSPMAKMVIQRFVPFPAVATASISNVVLMRNNELAEGIEVTDSAGNVVGTSKIAARKALWETALTRAFLPAPVLVIPPLLMTYLDRFQWFLRRPRLHLPVQATITTLCFGLALPFAIALFPQRSQIKSAKVEEEVRGATVEDTLFYNKGL